MRQRNHNFKHSRTKHAAASSKASGSTSNVPSNAVSSSSLSSNHGHFSSSCPLASPLTLLPAPPAADLQNLKQTKKWAEREHYEFLRNLWRHTVLLSIVGSMEGASQHHYCGTNRFHCTMSNSKLQHCSIWKSESRMAACFHQQVCTTLLLIWCDNLDGMEGTKPTSSVTVIFRTFGLHSTQRWKGFSERELEPRRDKQKCSLKPTRSWCGAKVS